MYNYKGYDLINKEWIYGELEIIINQEDLTSEYFIVNHDNKYKFEKDCICKLTPLVAGTEPVYDKDIINVIFSEQEASMFIVNNGDADLSFNGEEDVRICGLMLTDFKHTNYLFSTNLLKHPERIKIVGNTLENNLNEF